MFDVLNGRVQVSGPTADRTIGLLVERDELFCGVILSHTEAQKLAHYVLERLRISEAVDTSSANVTKPSAAPASFARAV
jgi:hypothetical protein